LLVPLERRMPRVDPTWAPDSKTIAYGYESNIYVVNAEDGKPKMITPPAKEREIKDLFRRPVFAPNGRSVTYKAGQKILATTMNGQETREIFHLKNNAFSIFDWAPDGRHIVFTSDTTSEIWCAPTDGSEPFQIGDISDVGNNALAQRPKWSPKGDAIAFIVNCEEYQYWVMENLLPVE
jgi:Tol biopolymer transport system component